MEFFGLPATNFLMLGGIGAAVFAGLGTLRPTERNEMEWIGRKVMSPAGGAGETVPALGASGVVRRLRLSSTKHKWRLGEGGLLQAN